MTISISEIEGQDFKQKILIKEMELLQSVFNKYDDWFFKTRALMVTIIIALLSVTFTAKFSQLLWAPSFLVPIFFIFEGTMRHEYWADYVRRHLVISNFLNGNGENKIHLYDTKNKLYEKKYKGKTNIDKQWPKIKRSFWKVEMRVFYGVIFFIVSIIGIILNETSYIK